MNNIEIRQKLHEYIDTAQQNKLEAIYAMVENDIERLPDYWNDAGFIEELEQRKANYLNEPASAYTLDASTSKAKGVLNAKFGKK